MIDDRDNLPPRVQRLLGPMPVARLLAAVEIRGLRFELVDGEPVLVGPANEITPALVVCVKYHKERIATILSQEAP